MKNCNLCPRKCNINRETSIGFCGVNNDIVISKVMIHTGEEPLLTQPHDKGSGAIFFSGCNLKCVYCQNYDISHHIKGKKFSVKDLVNVFKLLEDKGAGNIDLVTPTHYSKQIIQALKSYKPKVPVIWNSNGYESIETLKQLEGLVDIYLVDYKYNDDNLAISYSKAPNYSEIVKKSIREMKRQQPINIFDNNKLVKGIIVRHLLLPNNTNDSKKILDNIYNILGTETILSLMSQYVPMGKANDFEALKRTIMPIEYKIIVNYAKRLGFTNIYTQELTSSTSDFTPNFNACLFEF